MPRSAGAGTDRDTSALGPRAAAELASVEHERRSRVQVAQGDHFRVGHTQISEKGSRRAGPLGQNRVRLPL